MAASWWVVLQGQSTLSQILGRLTNPTEPIPQQATTAKVVQAATKPANYYKGPYATQAEAQAQADAYNNPNLGNEAEEVLNAGPSSGSGQSISQLGPLFQANIWIRVGEVVLGLILIAVGVAKLTHAVPAATKVAKSVGAVA